jgi:hypothetical protein
LKYPVTGYGPGKFVFEGVHFSDLFVICLRICNNRV